MKLVDVFSAPWAVTPSKFSEIQAIYTRHANGEKLDIVEMKKHGYGKDGKERLPFSSINGVAIIQVEGVISKKINLLQEISGGVSTQMLKKTIESAMEDSSVKSVLLNIDSPGGAVDGTPELANMIFESRGRKPIIAFSDGEISSAAFWIAAAADKIYISGKTVMVGSIGVVATHMDTSRMEEKSGLKVTEVVAGKFKRVASSHEPLSKEGLASIQEIVDDIFSEFVSSLARFKGRSEEEILETMADGSMFVGQKAVKAGLVDGIMTFEDLVSKMAEGDSPGSKITGIKEESMEITKEMIEEKHKDIAKALKAEGFAAGESHAKKEASQEGDFKNTEEFKSLKSSNEALESKLEGLTETCKVQSKELSIIKDNSSQALADGISVSILEKSSVPKELHGKVRSMVSHRSFVKEGEAFESGSGPAGLFSEAMTAEVEDWESKLGKSEGVGLESSKDDLGDNEQSDKKDSDLGMELARSISGEIRSDG